MYDWIIQNFTSYDNFILFLLVVGLFIALFLMFTALYLTFHDNTESEDKNNEWFNR